MIALYQLKFTHAEYTYRNIHVCSGEMHTFSTLKLTKHSTNRFSKRFILTTSVHDNKQKFSNSGVMLMIWHSVVCRKTAADCQKNKQTKKLDIKNESKNKNFDQDILDTVTNHTREG